MESQAREGDHAYVPPTAEQIAAMGGSNHPLGTAPSGTDAGERLERLAQTSNFDAESLARLSMSHSETYIRGLPHWLSPNLPIHILICIRLYSH